MPGGTHRAVQVALASGRITAGPAGIDPELADEQWATRTWRPVPLDAVAALIHDDGALERLTDELFDGLLAVELVEPTR